MNVEKAYEIIATCAQLKTGYFVTFHKSLSYVSAGVLSVRG